jgi:hypothetical protein
LPVKYKFCFWFEFPLKLYPLLNTENLTKLMCDLEGEKKGNRPPPPKKKKGRRESDNSKWVEH